MSTILHILQHALGRNEHGKSPAGSADYRNHFCTGEGSTDFALCREAVAQGLMREHPPREISGGDYIFVVTDAGKAFIAANSPPEPKLTRGQERYRRFLDRTRMCPMSDDHRLDYCTPWQVALRAARGASLCSDVDCDLSGGYAHIGPCEPCACGKQHAIEECHVGRGCALTPSEVALAKVLAAWESWPGRPDDDVPEDVGDPEGSMWILGGKLDDLRWVDLDSETVTANGRALLDRARKAGVL